MKLYDTGPRDLSESTVYDGPFIDIDPVDIEMLKAEGFLLRDGDPTFFAPGRRVYEFYDTFYDNWHVPVIDEVVVKDRYSNQWILEARVANILLVPR